MLPGQAALVRLSPINSSALPHGDKLIIEKIPLDSPFSPGSDNVSRARIRSKESPPRSQSCLDWAAATRILEEVASALLELSPP